MMTTAKTLEQSSDLLMEKIVDPDNLVRAWNKVRSNRGAPGPGRLRAKSLSEEDFCEVVGIPCGEQSFVFDS